MTKEKKENKIGGYETLANNTYLIEYICSKLFRVENNTEKNKSITDLLFNVTFSHYKEEKMWHLLYSFNDAISPHFSLSIIEKYKENLGKEIDRFNGRLSDWDSIKLTYYQYFGLLVNEYYLDNYFNNRKFFIDDYKKFLKERIGNEENEHIESSFYNKLAYWMATGSWKTIMMWINILQVLRYYKNEDGTEIDNIFILSPSEDLNQQHRDNLEKYNVIDTVRRKYGKEIIFLEFSKLGGEEDGKWKDAKTRNIHNYENDNNLIFVDEGHSGIWNSIKEGIQKRRREVLRNKNSFTFEYSATYAQSVGKAGENEKLEYYTSIIWNYSFKFFYGDNYGKGIRAKTIESETGEETQVVEALLSFSRKNSLYKKMSPEIIREYNLEKPFLAVFGARVAWENGDIKKLIGILNDILNKKIILEENDRGLIINHFFELEDINFKGSLEIVKIKGDSWELWLRVSWQDKYFWLVYVGKTEDVTKNLPEDLVKEDNFIEGNVLFSSIEKNKLNIIVGSKKFTTGWDTWRITDILLLNVGKWQGPQIVQILWRGVRLKGKNYNLKREASDNSVFPMQTLDITGFNSKYIDIFIKELKEELWEDLSGTIEEKEVKNRNILEKREIHPKLKSEIQEILYIPYVKKDIMLVLPTISIGKDIESIEEEIGKYVSFNIEINELIPKVKEYTPEEGEKSSSKGNEIDMRKKEELFINSKQSWKYNWLDLYMRLTKFLNENYKKYTFISLDFETIKQISIELIKSERVIIRLLESEESVIRENNLYYLDKLLWILWMKYLENIYKYEYKKELYKTVSYKTIKEIKQDEETYNGIFSLEKNLVISYNPEKTELGDTEGLENHLYKIKRGEGREEKKISFVQQKLEKDLNLVYPLLGIEDDMVKEKDKKLSINPIELNKGEMKFIIEFNMFLASEEGKKISEDNLFFLLRNTSKLWVGLFLEGSGSTFYPDFIIWKVDKKDPKKQIIYFIDPKGLRYLEEMDEKVQIGKELETKNINEDGSIKNIQVKAYLFDHKLDKGGKKSWHVLENNIITEKNFKDIF